MFSRDYILSYKTGDRECAFLRMTINVITMLGLVAADVCKGYPHVRYAYLFFPYEHNIYPTPPLSGKTFCRVSNFSNVLSDSAMSQNVFTLTEITFPHMNRPSLPRYCPGLCRNVVLPHHVCIVFLLKQPIATS